MDPAESTGDALAEGIDMLVSLAEGIDLTWLTCAVDYAECT